jgi:hypothetical protein
MRRWQAAIDCDIMPHAKYYTSHNLRLQRTIPCVGEAPANDRLAPNQPGSTASDAMAHRPQGRYRPVPDPVLSKAPQKRRPEFGSRCSY